jgi:Glyoxalase-like domain
MSEQAQLDHTVINVGYEMDRAAEIYKGLGFYLTDRGYHSLGSINHLMMFGTDYLELIGLPEDSKGKILGRPDIADAPYGLNGLVFKTTSAEGNREILETMGIAAGPVKSFSRPVSVGDGDLEASFTTAHVTEGTFPGGRVYFCEHHTPEVVWRPEWQTHDNGVQEITEFVIASTFAEEEADRLATILDTSAQKDGMAATIPLKNSKITVLSAEAYAARFGALACPLDDRRSIFGALQFRTTSLDAVRKVLSPLKDTVKTVDTPSGILVYEPVFNSLLEFTE